MPDIRMFTMSLRQGFILLLLVSPLFYGGGCSLFAKSALGKLGVTIPSLVREEQPSENHYDSDPDYESGNHSMRYRAQSPSWDANMNLPAPPPMTPPAHVDRVDVLAPLEPLPEELQREYTRLNPSDALPDNPWLGPTQQPEFSGDLWAEPEGGVSLHDIDEQVKAAEKDEKYRQTLNEAKKNKEKPWLDPLPHPYGIFAYRLESPTRGLGGEAPNVVQAGFQAYEPKPKEEIEFYDWEKDEEQRFDWNTLDPVNFVKKIRDWMGMGPDEREAAKLMQAGYDLMRQNDNFRKTEKSLEAAKMFHKAGNKWPDSVLEEDALFLAAECYFFSDYYALAAKKYEKLVSKYRSTKYMDTATMRLFKIGDYWRDRYQAGVSFVNFRDKTRPRLDTFGEMRKAYEAVYINDPSGPHGDRAILNLAGVYMNLGQNPGDSYFSEAAELYAMLPVVCPRSEHLAHAQKLELLARSSTYSGRQYDGKTLEEASVLADKITRQYGDQLGEDRAAILEIRENILHQKAERLWEAGQYYETKRMAYSAARYNYNKLLAEYPNSPRRGEAQQRLQAIEGLQDVDSNLARLKATFTPKVPTFREKKSE